MLFKLVKQRGASTRRRPRRGNCSSLIRIRTMQDTLNLQHKSPERWKWIPGFEGLYEASTWGRIRSVDRWVIYANGRKHLHEGRILKPRRTKGGYLLVTLYRDGKQHQFLIHRLVAETFIPNPENKPQIHHRDEDKTNNVVENLSYCTAKENINFGTGNKRRGASKSKTVEALDPETGVVMLEFPSTCEAGRNGFLQSTVSACCRGKQRTHKGLIWRYKES